MRCILPEDSSRPRAFCARTPAHRPCPSRRSFCALAQSVAQACSLPPEHLLLGASCRWRRGVRAHVDVQLHINLHAPVPAHTHVHDTHAELDQPDFAAVLPALARPCMTLSRLRPVED